MQYMGGKTRIAKRLAATIHECVPDATEFWDPFCGGLSVSVALSAYGRVVSSDANAALVRTYQAVREGWEPPDSVTREQYERARTLPDADPIKAFCAVGCSYGGKWFGGYATDRGTRNRNKQPSGDYAHSAKRMIQRATRAPAEVDCLDFLRVEPQPFSDAVYCDPPYGNTTTYAGVAPFDRDAFVRRVLEWSQYAHVFVSEYSFPVGELVWSGEQTTTLAKSHLRATERLYWIRKGWTP
jgi:DNA adenine methylase